ncbi:uncharacterized protein LOC143179052 isoform X3 [Calliopsis andreniformis]|uniref:uncharacterized protein LOC143179052 isoform X3 n=1 Tax=Calliopsis andreniformis TaxID=337506 RepID=UPI003FCC9110
MWFVLTAVYTFEILCIFVFVVYCVVAFLRVMYNTQTEELRKCIVLQRGNLDLLAETENPENVTCKIKVLTEKLAEKERAVRLQRSHSEIKKAEKVLSDLESKTSTCRDGYKSLMIELKKDVRKTEEEVKTLQSQISTLSDRREALRNEVLKEDYQKMLNNFTKELENKKSLFSSGIEKSRHPRVSSFALPR